MHQQSRLASTFPAIAKAAGVLVSIEEVEQHFANSKTANKALRFVCADSRCAVPVTAVITSTAKPQRKSSPASYFRSGRSNKHVCDKLPAAVAQQDGRTENGYLQASPQRSNSPTMWVDPRTVPETSSGDGPLEPTDDPDSLISGRGRQTSGNGTSQGSSQRVERFAKVWQTKTDHERKSTRLAAQWNKGGTYDSAFHRIQHWPDIRDMQEKIVVANVKVVLVYGTGYSIELTQRSADELPLSLWIPEACLGYGSAGRSLRQQIVAAFKSPPLSAGHEVFALGAFVETKVKGIAILSLTVAHPHMIWIA